MTNTKTLAARFLAFPIAAFAAYVARSGYYSHRLLCILVAAAAAVATTLDREVRKQVALATVLLVSTVLLLRFDDFLVSGSATDWHIWQFAGGLSVWWLPLLSLAAISNVLIPATQLRRLRPGTAVAAAAFVVIPARMSDVLTGYERFGPSLFVTLAVAALPFLPLPANRPAIYAWSIAEPCVMVLLGWLAVLELSAPSYVANDWRWLLLLLAAPVALTAVFTNWRVLLHAQRDARV